MAMRMLCVAFLLANVAPALGADVRDVVKLVEEKGWPIDFKTLCRQLSLPLPEGECRFRQISVEDTLKQEYPRGFNVPMRNTGAAPFVFVYHLDPQVGHFFVASTDGTLLKAFYRVRGGDYQEQSSETVREEFQRDVAYWIDNLDRVRLGLITTAPEAK